MQDFDKMSAEQAAAALAERAVAGRLVRQMRKEAGIEEYIDPAKEWLSQTAGSSKNWLAQNPAAAMALAGAGAGGLFGGATSLGRRDRRKNFLGNTLTGALAGGAVGGGLGLAGQAMGMMPQELPGLGPVSQKPLFSAPASSVGGAGGAEGLDPVAINQRLTELKNPGVATSVGRGIKGLWDATPAPLLALGAADVGMTGAGALGRHLGYSPISGPGFRAALNAARDAGGADADLAKQLVNLKTDQLAAVARHARAGDLSGLVTPGKLTTQGLGESLLKVQPTALRNIVGTDVDSMGQMINSMLSTKGAKPTGPVADALKAMQGAGTQELKLLRDRILSGVDDWDDLLPSSRYGPEVANMAETLKGTSPERLRALASSRASGAWGGLGLADDALGRAGDAVGGFNKWVGDKTAPARGWLRETLAPGGSRRAQMLGRVQGAGRSAIPSGWVQKIKDLVGADQGGLKSISGTGYGLNPATRAIEELPGIQNKAIRGLQSLDRGLAVGGKYRPWMLRGGLYGGIPLAGYLYNSYQADQAAQQQAAKLLERWQAAQQGG